MKLPIPRRGGAGPKPGRSSRRWPEVTGVSPRYLLGREPVSTDLGPVSGFLRGKRVLVTGAGGSIGSELCRQLDRLEIEELLMLDRDEAGLHALQLRLEGHGMMTSPRIVLGDVRDRIAMERVFRAFRPDVVFHSAALKHLPILERQPSEALKSNVWGTQNVLEAAVGAGCSLFVNISSDKAANPVSVLGWSKRVAERLTATAAAESGSRFVSVRFGNVLGSRGSVLDTFISQAEAGLPLTVTDRQATRYFMTISEAVQLMLQASLVGESGEALVLDMNAPVSVLELAQRVAAASPNPLSIVFTGLRPGEKLHESLFSDDERGLSSEHPLITRVHVPPLPHDLVRFVDAESPTVANVLREWCVTDRAGQEVFEK